MKEQIIEIETKSSLRTFNAEIEGASPISFSRHYDTLSVPRLTDKESPDAYEIRTWRNRLHINKDGHVYVPPTCIKASLVSTARFLSIRIPGKNQATYTKNFEQGLLVTEPMLLLQPSGNNGDLKPVLASEVPFETFFVPSDGKKGGGKRVRKNFPAIYTWAGIAKIVVLDDTIPNEIFGRVFVECGRFNGWGRFRPQTGGFYGRFTIRKLTVSTL
jgi:hypothetical protein